MSNGTVSFPFSFPLRLLFFILLVQVARWARASELHYGVNVQGLEKLADIDFKIVEFLLDLKEQNKTETGNFEEHSTAEQLIRKYILDVYRGLPLDPDSSGPKRQLDENFVEILIPGEERDHGRWIKRCNGGTVRAIADNPLSSFRLLHRFMFQIPKLTSMLKERLDAQVFENFEGILPKILPDSKDLKEARKSILRLYHSYNLKVSQYSRGDLLGISTGVQFAAVHCDYLARSAMSRKEYAPAIQWLWEAHNRLTNENDDTIDPKVVQQKMIKAIEQHNMLVALAWGDSPHCFDSAVYSQNGDVTSSRFAQGLELLIERFEQRRRENWEKVVQLQDEDKKSKPIWHQRGNLPSDGKLVVDPMDRFKSLCLGHNFQTPLEKSRLFCWYEYRQSFFYQIGPMKMEFLSRNPDVLQVYNVSGPERLKKLEGQLQGQLKRGSYLTLDNGRSTPEKSDFKISMDNIASYRRYDVGSIDRHIRLAPKIDDKTADYTFTMYPFGGQMLPHIDSKCRNGVKCQSGGDSFAIYQVFLAHTELGGQTAFPTLGFAAHPIGGSVLIWYNILGSGEPDYKTLHGGCPVLLGRKFKFTQNVLYYDQFLEYKCPLIEDERIKIKVNGKLPKI